MKNRIITAALAACALGVTCGFVTAQESFVGINYGPYHRPGQSPDRQSQIPDPQINSDMATILGSEFKVIKTYGLEDNAGLDRLIPILEKKNAKLYLGVYESSTWHSATEKQLNKAVALANNHPDVVACIVVGNECLDRDTPVKNNQVSLQQLIKDIQFVKNGLTGRAKEQVKVTTCLGWLGALNSPTLADGRPNSRYAAGKDYGKQLMQYCDSLMLNIYPFFGEEPVRDGEGKARAYDNTVFWYNYAVKNVAGGKPVILGEVGWPTAGKSFKAAVPNVPNQKQYIEDLRQGVAKGELGGMFLFEAFDEPWKTGHNGVEPHWGLWDKDGRKK